MKKNYYLSADPTYQCKEWKLLTEKILDRQPYCSICEKTFNLQIDHIIEHKNDTDLYWDENNLQVLCISCHGYKSGLEYAYSLIKKGNYKIVLTNDDNIYNKKNDYLSFYNYNIIVAFKRIAKELVKDRIVFLGVKDLKFNEIYYLLMMIMNEFKSKPESITCSDDLNENISIKISKWVYCKGVC